MAGVDVPPGPLTFFTGAVTLSSFRPGKLSPGAE